MKKYYSKQNTLFLFIEVELKLLKTLYNKAYFMKKLEIVWLKFKFVKLFLKYFVFLTFLLV